MFTDAGLGNPFLGTGCPPCASDDDCGHCLNLAGVNLGPAQVALGASHPNPAAAEARFTIELPEAADVTVGICDLRGRVITTLFRGHMPSGPREFRWDGRDATGSAAPNGVYFYRATVEGRTLARKLILMRRN